MNEKLLAFVKANFPTPGRALDLGSTQGIDSAALKEIGWEVKDLNTPAVDFNEVYTDEVKYDLVYSGNVLQFVNEKDNFVKTCQMNLKPGGHLFIQTFARGDKILKNKTFTEYELDSLFRYAFRDLKIEALTIKDTDFLIGDHEHCLFILTANN